MPQDIPGFAAAVTLLVGIILWLLGGKLLRVGACLTGVALAMIMSMLFLPRPLDPAITVVAILISSIVGLALGWVLFRLWMGLSLCLVFAVMVPISVLTFEDIQSPEQLIDPSPAMRRPVNLKWDRDPNASLILVAETKPSLEELEEQARERIEPAINTTTDWWHSLSRDQRTRAERIGFLSAIVGLVIGLLFPVIAARIQTSLLGAVLILASVINLAPEYAPDVAAYLPDSGKSFLAVVFMLAAIGFIFQCTITKRKADKESKPAEES